MYTNFWMHHYYSTFQTSEVDCHSSFTSSSNPSEGNPSACQVTKASLLCLVSESKDSESKAVPNVHHTTNLEDGEMWLKHSDIQKIYPEKTAPPDTWPLEDSAHDKPRSTRQQITKDVLDRIPVVLTRSTRVLTESSHHKLRVLQQLPANLKQHATKEPTRNGGDGPAGDELKDDTMEDMSEAVWIKHVLRHFRGIPGRCVERPPQAIVPSHCRKFGFFQTTCVFVFRRFENYCFYRFLDIIVP